jgi:hypothetical protein
MPDSEELTVKSVSMSGSNRAVVVFDDGYAAIFEGYSHGFGYQIEGFRSFELFDDDALIAKYNGRVNRYGGPDENRFIHVAEGCTLEMIVRYWEVSIDHINKEYFIEPHQKSHTAPKELWFPWIITSESGAALQNIKAGRRPFPNTHPTD